MEKMNIPIKFKMVKINSFGIFIERKSKGYPISALVKQVLIQVMFCLISSPLPGRSCLSSRLAS
jgi:hypothetical protein